MINKKTSSSERILSIDALRGFDMFWIIGGSGLITTLLTLKNTAWTFWLAAQFNHTEWNGFTFYDLIFPLFLFVVGLAIPFSLEKYRKGSINFKSAYTRIVTRTLTLFFLGLLVNGLLDFNFTSMRWPGVLQRIAICYFFAAIIALHIPSKFQSMVIGILLLVILFGYWAILKLIPVPGFSIGDLSSEGNLAGYLDRLIIPGNFCCYQFGDNEGLLSTIPALGTTLLGVLTGNLLRSNKSQIIKIKWIFLGGVVSLVLAIVWNFIFPINKILWTSSYVLFAVDGVYFYLVYFIG